MKKNDLYGPQNSDRAGYLLIRCNDRFVKAIAHRLTSIKMSLPEYRVLNIALDHNSFHNQATIALRLGMTQNAISKIVADLVERGWVCQQPNPINRREKFTLLTNEGKGILMQARRLSIETQEQLLSHLSKKEQEELKNLLRKICLSDR